VVLAGREKCGRQYRPSLTTGTSNPPTLMQYHLDFEVGEIGHPFCLCRHEGVTWTDKGVVWP
jgi:hypothetical protein